MVAKMYARSPTHTFFFQLMIPKEKEHYLPSGSMQTPRCGSHCAGLSRKPISEAITVLRGMGVPIGQAWVTCLLYNQDVRSVLQTTCGLEMEQRWFSTKSCWLDKEVMVPTEQGSTIGCSSRHHQINGRQKGSGAGCPVVTNMSHLWTFMRNSQPQGSSNTMFGADMVRSKEGCPLR